MFHYTVLQFAKNINVSKLQMYFPNGSVTLSRDLNDLINQVLNIKWPQKTTIFDCVHSPVYTFNYLQSETPLVTLNGDRDLVGAYTRVYATTRHICAHKMSH